MEVTIDGADEEILLLDVRMALPFLDDTKHDDRRRSSSSKHVFNRR